MKYFFIAMFCTSIFACQNNLKHNPQNLCFSKDFYGNVQHISLKDLSQLQGLNGQHVEIEGYFRDAFEDVSINLEPESPSSRGVWLNFIQKFGDHQKELLEVNEKLVTVIGIYNSSKKGHLGGYIGSLDSVFCLKSKN